MKLPISIIEKDIAQFISEDKKLCITSSFQTHSLPLLHIISRIAPSIPVLFIDTGYHFPETYQFRDQIARKWNLNLVVVSSSTPKSQQLDSHGRFLYTTSPDYCCYINKVLPLQKALKNYDVWIAGLRKEQTAFRKDLHKIQLQQNGQLKYHPILAWDSKMIHQYRQEHQLPEHPLEAKGYFSIGCMPCTTPPLNLTDTNRNGRWYGRNKTECGIHLTTQKK